MWFIPLIGEMSLATTGDHYNQSKHRDVDPNPNTYICSTNHAPEAEITAEEGAEIL